jgi:peptide/nickel transport system permease protein
VLALALALACARRRGLLDRALMAACALMMSVSAVMLVLILRRVLTGDLGPFPLRPWSPPYAPLLALPAVTWILIALWPELRLYRTLAVEESSRPWLLAARARGLSERRLWWGHLLPNLASPVLAHAALTLPFLLMGSLLLERAYDVPGLGEYLVDALAAHDARALEAATLLAAAAFVLTQAVADLCAARLDPRARAAQEATA